MPPLPDSVAPMLCRPGGPFDSDAHLFEVKWDGTRSLAFVEGGAHRLQSRKLTAQTSRYPELDFLASLPRGTLLDGEIVVLVDGRVAFGGMLEREQARTERRAAELARSRPATYVVFDLLFRDGFDLRARPLHERRAHLAEVVAGCADPRLVLSDGLVGGGRAYFEQACAAGLEGMVAKRLDGRYESGQRSGSWTKCKRTHALHCLVLGWIPDGARDFKSLVLAADLGDGLRCVGRVGGGFTQAQKRDVFAALDAAQPASAPLVPSDETQARWIEPGLYCSVTFLEITGRGTLRAPVFQELVRDP